MSSVCANVFLDSLDLRDRYSSFGDGEHPIWYATPDSYHTKRYRGAEFVNFMATALRVGFEDNCLQYFDGTKVSNVNVFQTTLNTALAVGSDPLKLYARLHGQCEVHAFVEGENRKWLADIIQRGLDIGLYRTVPRGYDGWEAVVTMLRKRDDEPVVTSYSVCESFPNHTIVQNAGLINLPFYTDEDGKVYEDEYDIDPWEDLTDEERWNLGMNAIRLNEGWLELTPKHWDWPDWYFGDKPLTGFHVLSTAVAMKENDPNVRQARERKAQR